MKRLFVFVVLYSMVLIFSLSTYAGNLSTSKKKGVVKSLIEGINSDNAGLRLAALEAVAGFIEENILHKDDLQVALFPLMKILREGKTDDEKIAAALSVYRLEDMRGIYLLKGTAKFADSYHVREMANGLYIRFHMENNISYTDDFNKSFSFISAGK